MKQTLQDLRAFERVFLLDRLDERFPLGSSSWNAKQKRVLTRIAIVLAISLLFGVPMTTLNRAYGKVGRYLTKKGVATEGVIAEKQIDDQGEGRNYCTLVYEFQAPTGTAPQAPNGIFRREQEVSDQLCDHTRTGQRILVLYDPKQPEVSMLEPSIRSPLITT